MTAPPGLQMDLDQNDRRFTFPHPDHGTEGHEASVYAIDLKYPYLVSGSADRTIRIWDVESRRLVGGPLTGHEGSVVCLQSDLENDIIVSGSTDGSVIIWGFSTSDLVKHIVNAHEDTILDLCFDNNFIVTGSRDRLVKIWSRPSTFDAQLAATLDVQQKVVNAVEMQRQADDTRIIVAGSGDGTVNMWSMEASGSEVETKHIRAFTAHTQGIASMAIYGNQLLSGSSNNAIKIHGVDTGALIASLEGHTNIVRTLQAIGEAGTLSTLVSGCYSGTVRFWKKSGHDQGEDSSRQWEEVRRLEYDGEHNPASSDDAFWVSHGTGQRAFEVQVASEDGRNIVICAGQENVIVGWNIEDVIS